MKQPQRIYYMCISFFFIFLTHTSRYNTAHHTISNFMTNYSLSNTVFTHILCNTILLLLQHMLILNNNFNRTHPKHNRQFSKWNFVCAFFFFISIFLSFVYFFFYFIFPVHIFCYISIFWIKNFFIFSTYIFCLQLTYSKCYYRNWQNEMW